MIIETPIENIKIGSRFRQDMGDLQILADSIAAEGLLQPIGITENDELVFGERRIQAALLLGWQTIPARIVQVSSIMVGEYHENEIRKDFTTSERVAIGREIEKLLGNRQGQRMDLEPPQHIGEVSKGEETAEIAARKAGFGNPETYRLAKKTIQQGVPELVRKMDDGIVSIPVAATVAEQLPEKQKEIASLGKKEILKESKKIRTEEAEKRRQERIDKLNQVSSGQTSLDGSTGLFPVLYADPPWRYDHSSTVNREVENHYPTMTIQEICALPVTKVTTDDCILFLWTTSPKLEEAFRVLNAWGFAYRTCAVWDKQKIGMGYYFRQQHELLLVATKGKIPPPLPANRPSSVISSTRGKHSKKPDELYTIIEQMYPELPKLELFARQNRKGWSAWGNQVKAA
jgi:N6-adenosine-specific RNA methylase IME4